MGSRTDFVDRNNFIILEYREKDPLDVTLWLKADATNEHPECVIEDTPEAAVGLEKCKWTVNALINHHYKIISASRAGEKQRRPYSGDAGGKSRCADRRQQ